MSWNSRGLVSAVAEAAVLVPYYFVIRPKAVFDPVTAFCPIMSSSKG